MTAFRGGSLLLRGPSWELGDCALVIRLGGKYLYLLNLLTGPFWSGVVQLWIRKGARPLTWKSPLVSQAWFSYRLGQLLQQGLGPECGCGFLSDTGDQGSDTLHDHVRVFHDLETWRLTLVGSAEPCDVLAGLVTDPWVLPLLQSCFHLETN